MDSTVIALFWRVLYSGLSIFAGQGRTQQGEQQKQDI
jgi:hypothetical protein